MVGLLTSEIQINPHAQIIITVPEILRSMLVSGDNQISNLAYVVIDEIHCITYILTYFESNSIYRADDRGFNWEHILLLLPESIPFVALSATVGEPLDFLGWLQSFRKEVYYIATEIRRVPLRYYIYGNRLLPLNHHVFTQNEAAKLKTMETLRAALVTAAIVEALNKLKSEEVKAEVVEIEEVMWVLID